MVKRCLNCMKMYNIPGDYDDGESVCPFCGYIDNTPPKEITYLFPGTVLQNRYIIGTTLGAGGFGITYKAWDTALEMIVAIKEYYPAGMVQRVPGDVRLIIYAGRHQQEFYAGLERFLEEARKMALFNNSRNIVHVENHFEANNTAYIVMEYLDGISVKQFLEQEGGKLDITASLEIVFEVSAALQEIHKASILHRDISPDNVFLCEGNKIKLLDFGAARLSNAEAEVTRSIILKPGFAPPEQYQSKSKQGPWTDIYALSAMLYRCITGVMPDESTNRVIEDTLVPPAALDPNIPEYISNSIMKGMSLNTELRFQNIEEFQKALLNEKRVRDEEAELKHRKRRRIVTIAAMAVLLAIGGFIAWRIYDNKDPVLDEAEITVWVAASGDYNPDDVVQMINDMSEVFLEDQPAVSIEVEVISEDVYAERLKVAEQSGDMPTVYLSEYASEDIQRDAASVEPVYDSLGSMSEYYFLRQYRSELEKAKTVPFGFNIPVVYVRRSDDVDADTFTMTDFSEITSKGYYTDPAYLPEVLNTLGGEFYYDNGLVINAETETMVQDISDMMKALGNPVNETEAMDRFLNSQVIYYLASVRELDAFNSNAAGLYEMRPVITDTPCGEFADCYSISGDATDAETEAAQVWMRYMLQEGPQKTYHLVNRHSIPLQKDAYEVYIGNNSKLDIINEYMDNLVFYPEKAYRVNDLCEKMWSEVVVNRRMDISEWYERQD